MHGTLNFPRALAMATTVFASALTVLFPQYASVTQPLATIAAAFSSTGLIIK